MGRTKKKKEGEEEPPEPGAQPGPEEPQAESDKVSILPKKDFRIKQKNKDFNVDIQLREGVKADIPKRYFNNLVTEGVIDKEEV